MNRKSKDEQMKALKHVQALDQQIEEGEKSGMDAEALKKLRKRRLIAGKRLSKIVRSNQVKHVTHRAKPANAETAEWMLLGKTCETCTNNVASPEARARGIALCLLDECFCKLPYYCKKWSKA